VDAIEAGKRDIMSAARPVKFFMKVLNALSPGLVDSIFLKY